MANLSFSFANPLKDRFGEEFFKALPSEAGVYFFLDDRKKPLYIGKAESLRKRLASYKNAKPGQTPEHILEMIEHAQEIVWETHKDGVAAIRRESELIRSVRPPFNIAGTDPIPFLFCGVKVGAEARPGILNVEFRLSHKTLPKGFETFGCFMHRGKTKAGYSALLRLFFAATCDRDRFHLPAKICRTSPAYIHTSQVPEAWIKNLTRFLRGESSRLLNEILSHLLAKENLPAYLYAPLQRDLHTAREFYTAGPISTRKLLRSAGLTDSYLPQAKMLSIASRVHGDFIKNLQLAR